MGCKGSSVRVRSPRLRPPKSGLIWTKEGFLFEGLRRALPDKDRMSVCDYADPLSFLPFANNLQTTLSDMMLMDDKTERYYDLIIATKNTIQGTGTR